MGLHSTRPMRRALLPLASFAALLLAGWLLYQGRPQPPPPSPLPALPAPPPPPAQDPQGRHLATLRTVHDRVLADPAVRAALALEDPLPASRAQKIWQEGRRALAAGVARSGLEVALWQLARPTPHPEAYPMAVRLALAARLLSASADTGWSSPWASGNGPGLDRFLRRGVAVRWDPAFHARAGETEAQARKRFEQPGDRRWAVLRTLEDLTIPDGPAQGVNVRVWYENGAGTRFRDPSLDVPHVVDVGIYEDRDRIRTERAAREVDLPLEPPPGDLFLNFRLWRLFEVAHARVELVGSEATLPFLISRRDADLWGAGPRDNQPGSLGVRVRRELLPAGLRRLRLRIVALQPVGISDPCAALEEVRVQVGGPPPAVFAGHDWEQDSPSDATLDAAQRARLDAQLEPLRARLDADPHDADAHLGVAHTYRDAGQLDDAAAAVARALREGAPRAPALTLLGDLRHAQGAALEARQRWMDAFELDPAGRALDQLRAHAPEALDGLYLIADADEFVDAAEYLQDFRRQDQVLAALRAHWRATNQALDMTAAGWRDSLRTLASAGRLDHPGGPPSGQGEYRIDGQGRITSTRFGRRDAPLDPPPALAAPRSFRVTPRVLWDALATGNGAALEVGVGLLPPREVRENIGRLGRHLEAAQDPGVRAALLDVLAPLFGKVEAPRLQVLVPALGKAARAGADLPAWRARALLSELGHEDLPDVPDAELDRMLIAVDQGRLSRAAPRAVMRRREPRKVGGFLRDRLTHADPALAWTAVQAFPYYAERWQAPALLAGFDAPHGDAYFEAVGRALSKMTGLDVIPDANEWKKALLEAGFGKNSRKQ